MASFSRGIMTTDGTIRQTGDDKVDGSTPAVFAAAIKCSMDPTSASAVGTGKFLPANCYPVGVISLGGATGGTAPTFDVGTTGDPDGFANELQSDIKTEGWDITKNGVLIGTLRGAQTEIFARGGTSLATGGTTDFLVLYVMNDAGGW